MLTGLPDGASSTARRETFGAGTVEFETTFLIWIFPGKPKGELREQVEVLTNWSEA